MKAIVIYEKGPAKNLLIEDMPDLEPGPSDAIVKVSYSGINYGDIIRRERGLFPQGVNPPYILGFEGAGTVFKVGSNVQKFKIGQRVVFLVESGGYAQLVRVPQTQLFQIPDEIPSHVAAGSVCVGLTAYHLVRLADMEAGQNVLIHGGAGGVGSTLIQFCKQQSVKVFTTVSSEDKAQFVRSLGADVVINYRQLDFAQEILAATEGVGVNYIFDGIGKEVVEGNFRCLSKKGHLLYYGSVSGYPQFPGDKVLMNEIRITGFNLFGSVLRSHSLLNEGVHALFTTLSNGKLRILVKILPMNEVVLAHEMLEKGEVCGKIVLNMQ